MLLTLLSKYVLVYCTPWSVKAITKFIFDISNVLAVSTEVFKVFISLITKNKEFMCSNIKKYK